MVGNRVFPYGFSVDPLHTMTPALTNAAQILPGILAAAIPVPGGPGYYLHVEGAELDALRELAIELWNETLAESGSGLRVIPLSTFPETGKTE